MATRVVDFIANNASTSTCACHAAKENETSYVSDRSACLPVIRSVPVGGYHRFFAEKNDDEPYSQNAIRIIKQKESRRRGLNLY